MLAKIESAYLYILRVLILAVASLALIVVVWGAARALPTLVSQLGPKSVPSIVSGASLRDWVIEKKAEGVSTSSDDSSPPDPVIPTKIQTAVGDLSRYSKERLNTDLDRPVATSALMDIRNSIPAPYQQTYEDSLASTMLQLVHSKGQPLDLDKIKDLIVWHGQKVKDFAESKIQEDQIKQAEAIKAIAISGGALGIFILIVFCFLFVKIERNLRLVHVSEEKVP